MKVDASVWTCGRPTRSRESRNAKHELYGNKMETAPRLEYICEDSTQLAVGDGGGYG